VRKFIEASILLVAATFTCGAAEAAELRVLITNGMKPVMAEVAAQFEHSSGLKLSIRYEGSAILQQEIARGDTFDVAMLITSNMDAIAKLDKIAATTRVDVARSGLGMVVGAGRPKPDISTVDAFKRAMLDAKSIAYVTKGASGIHFIAVCERLGIAEQVKAKGKTLPTGTVAEFVANGEAELAIQQKSELVSLKGTDLLGPLPPEVDLVSLIAAAASASTKESDAAKAFIKFFATPEVITVIKAKGMDPA
jgi:molybdate transport system substrate-binding protein